jgi:hypothetical protein
MQPIKALVKCCFICAEQAAAIMSTFCARYSVNYRFELVQLMHEERKQIENNDNEWKLLQRPVDNERLFHRQQITFIAHMQKNCMFAVECCTYQLDSNIQRKLSSAHFQSSSGD